MVGRSELCPCGSGKKYKRCCGAGVPAGQPALSGFPLAHQMYQQRRYREAEQVCEQTLRAQPNEADGWFLRAACALEQQAYDRAQQAMQRAADLAPNRPEVHFNLGHVHERRGDTQAAISAYRKAVQLSPGYAQAWTNLGNVLRAHGQVSQAVAAYRETTRLSPGAAPAWTNLGVALKAAGELDEATQSYEQALACDARHAPAHNNLGNLHAARHDYAAAEASLREALRIDPAFADAHLNLGHVLRKLGRFDEALASTREALRLQPDSPAVWAAYAEQLQGFRCNADDPGAREDFTRALRHSSVDPLSLVPAAVSLLKHTPGLMPLLDQSDPAVPPISALAPWFSDPLLSALLENAVIADWTVESALRRVRAALLEAADQNPPSAALGFAAILALQSLLTDYVYMVTPGEAMQVDALQARLEAALADGAKAVTPAWDVIRYASYRPLASLRGHDHLRPSHPALAAVLAAHLEAPREEAQLRANLGRLGPVSDEVSRKVQAQYEEHPYPRWVRVGMQGPQPLAQVARALAPNLALPASLSLESPQVLVAGCGTGRHPIQTASRIAGAHVLAVDLSSASLGYAMRKARELGVSNLEFMQADILELGALGQQYDLIESFGVLHHMRDPLAGWRVLTDLLKPGGLMVIGLYSERARAPVVACREYVRERGYGSDDASIRRFRQDLLRPENAGGAAAQVAAAIMNSPDFYTISDCRDLIFHVQEHRYTLPQIAQMGASLGLACLGMDLDDAALYAAGEPGSLPALNDLTAWDRFEQAHPQAFGSTYKIWWQKPA
jgi:tetratricopeptide (TPR) repeat protein/SAM-dependent methyltransferase